MKLFKSDLKALAQEIRSLKSQRKTSPNGYVYGLGSAQFKYRHMHIAYCLMRGKTIEQIENKVNDGNHHSEQDVERYIRQYTEVKDEAVCIGG